MACVAQSSGDSRPALALALGTFGGKRGSSVAPVSVPGGKHTSDARAPAPLIFSSALPAMMCLIMGY